MARRRHSRRGRADRCERRGSRGGGRNHDDRCEDAACAWAEREGMAPVEFARASTAPEAGVERRRLWDPAHRRLRCDPEGDPCVDVGDPDPPGPSDREAGELTGGDEQVDRAPGDADEPGGLCGVDREGAGGGCLQGVTHRGQCHFGSRRSLPRHPTWVVGRDAPKVAERQTRSVSRARKVRFWTPSRPCGPWSSCVSTAGRVPSEPADDPRHAATKRSPRSIARRPRQRGPPTRGEPRRAGGCDGGRGARPHVAAAPAAPRSEAPGGGSPRWSSSSSHRVRPNGSRRRCRLRTPPASAGTRRPWLPRS